MGREVRDVVSLRNVVDGCATTTGFCIRTKPETFVEVNIKIAEQSDNLTVLHIATNYFRQFNLRIYLYEEDGRWMDHTNLYVYLVYSYLVSIGYYVLEVN